MAGRRPLAIGSYGNISYRTLARRKVRARAKVRDADGVIRDVTREGTSQADAKANLLEAIERRPGFSGSEITEESTIADTAQAWLTEIDRYVAEGQRAPNTAAAYHSVVSRHVEKTIGALRLREATTPRLDAYLVGFRAQHGRALTKTVRTVLNGILGYATRNGAIDRNPLRDVSRIAGGRPKLPRALTPAERDAWLAAMEADEAAAFRDIPDLTRWLLATGCRIGEALALTFDEVDVDDKTVDVRYTLYRVKGVGLVRGPTKSAAGERVLRLPGWAVDLVIRRGDKLGWRGPLFPVPGWREGKPRQHGAWRDPNNTMRNFRKARERAGFGWVTSHVFRKTVASVLHDSGLVPREVADQLGHADLRTQKDYIGRTVEVVDNAALLEGMFGEG